MVLVLALKYNEYFVALSKDELTHTYTYTYMMWVTLTTNEDISVYFYLWIKSIVKYFRECFLYSSTVLK